MKKIHIFILKSYVGPLLMTFFISMFILVMQFLWRYVDDLVGKGLEWNVLSELLFYASLQVIPMALPLAILLASLMTFGNLGENYELTALKSAGISLPRIMMPLIILTILTSIGAYKFSNNVLPVANLKLVSILHGIKETRLELDIKENVFYQGVDDFSIKVKEKDPDKNMLYDVMIYDHRDRYARNSNVTLADSGKLMMSADKKFLQLTLYNGIRYDEKIGIESQRRDNEEHMFRTDHFKVQTAIIPLKGFDFSKTDENLFKHSDRMKNLDQLQHDLDSLNREKTKFVDNLRDRSKSFFFSKIDYNKRRNSNVPKNQQTIYQIDSSKIVNTDSIFNAMSNTQKQMVLDMAMRQARNTKQTIDERLKFIEQKDGVIRRHKMEMHRKFTLPFACLIFFFIGAPLGAIIRKGGLGMPVVISVIFFVAYYIIDTIGAKMAREGVWLVFQGMWLSSAILLPLGIFLTYKSATDSAVMNADAYTIFIDKLLSKFKKKKK
ncbi:MAG: lipopolysaccharide export system permease protein [Anaerophaga sp.]|uniref:LptF/LptG family permease n=1 Tax=Anaerophaga thermohalophila TaxID=177400 RepID=UPI000237BAF3|nr:LptF/LptG family permease [Anaerophaga thermohalophila]MDI3521548.1 lipopolysaccharide export system permease protein [Anaerophaga sp.]MDK2841224.1 lipopolysaccharide export system permease protein [Anaerophaga sp.]MDN5290410.1 lipopolysaccharide export system permease protein [Anaerophaga sp.]